MESYPINKERNIPTLGKKNKWNLDAGVKVNTSEQFLKIMNNPEAINEKLDSMRKETKEWLTKYKINLTEEEFNKIFVFTEKGIHMYVGNIYFESLGITEFIPNVLSVTGSLYLIKNKLKDTKSLPKSISQSLFLADNPIEDLSDLPKFIGNDLLIGGIPAKTIPENLIIKGKIVLFSIPQKELREDAERKGYDVIGDAF